MPLEHRPEYDQSRSGRLEEGLCFKTGNTRIPGNITDNVSKFFASVAVLLTMSLSWLRDVDKQRPVLNKFYPAKSDVSLEVIPYMIWKLSISLSYIG